ncbi:hypothetical protein DPMN_051425 [Dreissena polymorpha]|uniref:Uncharacterized protein n=1 Tax=Dreissena polymorpha TaxID=45954 RepID=A0A9D4CJ33_DREPO|nr:hypothetical protein DPMN_051425 [Dreissena polymorpha]
MNTGRSTNEYKACRQAIMACLMPIVKTAIYNIKNAINTGLPDGILFPSHSMQIRHVLANYFLLKYSEENSIELVMHTVVSLHVLSSGTCFIILINWKIGSSETLH